MCINEAVKRLKALSLINDRCLELQKSKSGEPNDTDYQYGVFQYFYTRAGCMQPVAWAVCFNLVPRVVCPFCCLSAMLSIPCQCWLAHRVRRIGHRPAVLA